MLHHGILAPATVWSRSSHSVRSLQSQAMVASLSLLDAMGQVDPGQFGSDRAGWAARDL